MNRAILILLSHNQVYENFINVWHALPHAHSIQSDQLGLRTDSSVKCDALICFTVFIVQTCLIMCICVHALKYSTVRQVHIALPSRFHVLARKFHPARLFK